MELAQITPASESIERWVADVAAGLGRGELAPYLGPGIAALTNAPIPHDYDALAAFFAANVALPKRARGNAWASAQYIESRMHRSSLSKLMARAFATPATPHAFHRYLAGLGLPLIVQTWYDGAMRTALAEASAFAEVQGAHRADAGETRFYRTYDEHGAPLAIESVDAYRTVLYAPHGGIGPAEGFVVADSDYVEILAEIDIQTPIPEVVRRRRNDLGFVFLGCRFDDMMLRSFARQIGKRSRGPHFVVVDPRGATRNERRFVESLGARVLVAELPDVVARLERAGSR